MRSWPACCWVLLVCLLVGILPAACVDTGTVTASRVRVEQEQPKPSNQWPPTFRNTIGMEFVLIPADEFMMGSPDTDGEAHDEEKPAHRVRITQPFYLGKYEVTQRQWKAVVRRNPSDYRSNNRPVEYVSWDDAQAFIQKLNAKEGGTKYRLPTEAEWEYAARAGTATAYSFGDNPNQLGEYAWYFDNSGHETHPVGQLKPNSWGLYDMHGNVWEWVADDWHDNYDTVPNDGRAWIDDPRGASRVIRGGSWLHDAGHCQVANRHDAPPGARGDALGFRLARSATLGP